MLIGPYSGFTAIISVPEAATIRAAAPALSVIEEVVFGLTSNIFTVHTPFPASVPNRSLRLCM